MRIGTITGFAVALFAVACASRPRVSPWGEAGAPSLRPFLAPPDLAAVLARIERETAALGLGLAAEHTLALGGETLVVRSYVGRDALGRATTATRAASPAGVVLAVGPLREGELGATELVPPGDPALGGLSLGADLDGDRRPELALRDGLGHLALHRVTRLGASSLEVAALAPPTGLGLGEDGAVLVFADVTGPEGDALSLRLEDVVAWDGARFSSDAPAARAEHARRAEVGTTDRWSSNDPRATALATAVARAFHGVRAGELSPKAAAAELDRETPPAELRGALEGWRRFVASLGARRR